MGVGDADLEKDSESRLGQFWQSKDRSVCLSLPPEHTPMISVVFKLGIANPPTVLFFLRVVLVILGPLFSALILE